MDDPVTMKEAQTRLAEVTRDILSIEHQLSIRGKENPEWRAGAIKALHRKKQEKLTVSEWIRVRRLAVVYNNPEGIEDESVALLIKARGALLSAMQHLDSDKRESSGVCSVYGEIEAYLQHRA